MKKAIFARTLVGVGLMTLFATPTMLAQEQTQEEERRQFGGSYEGLTIEQQVLVEKWFVRFTEVTGREIDPEQAFNNAPLSVRTTFDAVTNALQTTELTDENGASLGTALALIDEIEYVAGKVEGAGGDEQFRIYIMLVPGAVQTLYASQEFTRKGDNTIYHKGYPMNFRQEGKVPNMQISIALDEIHADVDVDYRASGFPNALFNGHLTASNSDVRAGNNYDRHSGRWLGLNNWWRGIFGIPLTETSDYEEEAEHVSFERGSEPPMGKGKLEEAAHDFLNGWLVEQAPDVSMTYFDPEAFACAGRTEGEELANRGLAPWWILARMTDLNTALGPVADLGDVVTPFQVRDEVGLKRMGHRYENYFEMYDVAEDLAVNYECANRDRLTGAGFIAYKQTYGRYFTTILRMKFQDREGPGLALIWRKIDGNWKIVSWVQEPTAEGDAVPDLRPEIAPVVLERIDGDPVLIERAGDFLHAWFADKDYDRAFGYLAPSTYACAFVFVEDDYAGDTSPEAGAADIREGIAELGEILGPADVLTGAIRAVEFQSPMIKIVTHDHEDIYTIGALPNVIAEAYLCERRLAGHEPPQDPNEYGDEMVYGNYFAEALHLRTVAGSPAALYLLWGRDADEWKIVSYHIELP